MRSPVVLGRGRVREGCVLRPCRQRLSSEYGQRLGRNGKPLLSNLPLVCRGDLRQNLQSEEPSPTPLFAFRLETGWPLQPKSDRRGLSEKEGKADHFQGTALTQTPTKRPLTA